MDWLFSDLYHLFGLIAIIAIVSLLVPYLSPLVHHLRLSLGYLFPVSHPESIHDVTWRHRLTKEADEERHNLHALHVGMKTAEITHNAEQHAAIVNELSAKAHANNIGQSVLDDYELKRAIFAEAARRGVDAVLSQQLIAKYVEGHLGEAIHKLRTGTELDKLEREYRTKISALKRGAKVKDEINERRSKLNAREVDSRTKTRRVSEGSADDKPDNPGTGGEYTVNEGEEDAGVE